MGVREVRAGGAYVELTIRDKIAQGLRNATGRLRAFGNVAASLAGSFAGFAGISGSIFSIVGASKHFADLGSQMHDLAMRTGLTADNMSELKYAADQTGTSIDVVEKGLRAMEKNGINPKKFDEVLKAISEIADEAERTQAALAIFGKFGTQLLPMAGELPQLRAEARALGVSISPRQADRADELGDAFGRLKSALSGVMMQVGSAFAPAMTNMIDMLTIAVVNLGKFSEALSSGVNSMTSAFQSSVAVLHEFFKEADKGMGPSVFLGWLRGGPKDFRDQFKRRTVPDFTQLDGLTDMKGGSSRGTFSGFRAENLSIGSGGGTLQELKGIKAILEKIHMAEKDTARAVEDIDGNEFD